MRPGFLILLLVFIGAASGFTQQLQYDAPPESQTNAVPPSSETHIFLEGNEELTTSATTPEEIVAKDKLQITGPLAHPARAKGFMDFSRRLLDLVNPFTKATATDQRLRVERDSQAWATIVGWSPGRSAFPDDEHQQGGLRLLSISTGPGK